MKAPSLTLQARLACVNWLHEVLFLFSAFDKADRIAKLGNKPIEPSRTGSRRCTIWRKHFTKRGESILGIGTDSSEGHGYERSQVGLLKKIHAGLIRTVGLVLRQQLYQHGNGNLRFGAIIT